MNVERHSWCAGVLSLSRPGALRGISAGGQGPAGGRWGGWRVYWLGCARGRVKPGSGARAGQTRIGKGPGQNRIGNTGGSNPKREKRQQEKNKKIKKKKNVWLQPHWPGGYNRGYNRAYNHAWL